MSAITGQTERQLKTSDASFKELKAPLNVDEAEVSLDQPEPKSLCDLYDIDSDENLDFKPLIIRPKADEPSDIDGDYSPAASSDKDEATSDGEESTDSDYDFEVTKLFAWLDKKDWARSYYDCDDGVVIHVEPGQVEASQRILAEEFPDFHKYRVVETEPGVCRYCADPFEGDEEKPMGAHHNQTPNPQNLAPTINTQPTEVHSPEEPLDTQAAKAQSLEAETESQATGGHVHGHVEFESVRLQPGYIITSDEHPARFSGRVGSKGLTVAHIGPSNNIHHYCYSSEKQHLIGTMEKVLEVLAPATRGAETTWLRTTADLGLLDLTGNCRVTNTICYKGIYRLKLYKGRIKKGTLLRIIDQYGAEKHGKLTFDRFTLKRKEQDSSLVDPKVDDWSREVRNMLRIQNEDRAISAEGDSGTLVTSIPKEGSNEVYVYGIVTHLHKEEKCEQPSATIANRLSDILGAIDGKPGKSVGLRHPKSNDIDFTEDED